MVISIISSLKKTATASIALQSASDAVLKRTLVSLAKVLEQNIPALLKANQKDIAQQEAGNPRLDRLLLNEQRIKAIANSIRNVSKLPNPSNKIIEQRILPNGLRLKKIAVPLGVVGAIYESRPNVTFDIAALCLRSANACVLKGSSDAEFTNKAAISIIQNALEENGLPKNAVTLLPSARETVNELFTATKYIDVLIPRGSDNLIQYVRKNSLVPVIETGAGVCHVYVAADADIEMAVNIVVNAKVSRPSVCNAMDTLLIDEKTAPAFLEQLKPAFSKYSVGIYADTNAYKRLTGYPHLHKAKPADFDREFLSLQCAVKIVSGLQEALLHIREHSTKHSEAIVTNNKKEAQLFLQQVDAAAVYHNASTRFTDGEEFGLGAEVGISTQKLHARGPFALEKLVTEKWVAEGNGQVR
ncbi:glutamate-5-semialdehyde dehydrogenase [Ferruginibacter sp. HRS2-29]|uniref:glutamate-5-semialdehyde dehydrogenase n=1 Tax=Ferruginibacter sp. HRS2-29 TaxID=2487334 RepID=UPI0020CF3A86|nr:glutamate-5-semialdehyde dehydrogenase [Ferruginibacter sp. HRS2-29]MCP9752581.1 glutamate-5-semialdehyde dehydrogenase [Ferruginibacter sp. HRS2-29]